MVKVDWREWGDAAFEEARRLDRPILLDIGAVWCHWCHVMDHGVPGDPIHTGTYSNPEIVETINLNYIPIKVDNDRRPDINARYNMGGWPTTAFLTPEGEPLYGVTYVTPPQMIGLLESIVEYYRGNKEAIGIKAREDAASRMLTTPRPGEDIKLSSDIGDYVGFEIKENFDPLHGGFGTQPKFPHADAINFALQRFASTADKEYRLVAEKTLLDMSSGGIYDQFAGGFFRYSTTRDWSIPHYEKMLEDNGRLLLTYLLAYQILGDSHFADIARDVQRFLMDVLYDAETGTFAGSQDADREDEYYGRPLSERESMSTPFIDRTIFVDWNALVVSALCGSYQLLDDSAALQVAIRLYDFLTTHVAPSHFYVMGQRQGPKNQLTDLDALVGAAIDLFESTGENRYLSEARGLVDIALSELFSEEAQRFRDIPIASDVLGSLKLPVYNQEDNAHFSAKLLRLAAHTESLRYREAAESVLRSFASNYQQQSFFSAGFAISVELSLVNPIQIILIGEFGSNELEQMKRAAYSVFAPGKFVKIMRPGESLIYSSSPDNMPIAYVCIGTTCLAPTTDPQELRGLINQAAKYIRSSVNSQDSTVL